jgi:cbb3-type cytochrome oxidase subunit 1
MLGGVCFLTGGLIMVYNLIRTVTRPTTAVPRQGLIAPAVSPTLGLAGA